MAKLKSLNFVSSAKSTTTAYFALINNGKSSQARREIVTGSAVAPPAIPK